MPRSTKSHAVQEGAGVDTIDPDEDETATDYADVDEATEEDEDEDEPDPAFDFVSEPAPEDFTPDRKTPGRVRRPSYFDDILRRDDVFNSGRWQRIPVQSPEHREAAKRELNRAKLYLNKEGLLKGLPEIGLDLDEREDAVYYRARVAQKRERKNGAPVAETEVESYEGGEFEDEE